MIDYEIEYSFEKSLAVDFFLQEDRNKGPHIMAIIYSDPYDGLKAYEFLKQQPERLSIFFKKTSNNTLDFSIIDSSQNSIMNVKNRLMNNDNFERFLKDQPIDGVFIFLLLRLEANNSLTICTLQEYGTFSAIEIKGYQFKDGSK